MQCTWEISRGVSDLCCLQIYYLDSSLQHRHDPSLRYKHNFDYVIYQKIIRFAFKISHCSVIKCYVKVYNFSLWSSLLIFKKGLKLKQVKHMGNSWINKSFFIFYSEKNSIGFTSPSIIFFISSLHNINEHYNYIFLIGYNLVLQQLQFYLMVRNWIKIKLLQNNKSSKQFYKAL